MNIDVPGYRTLIIENVVMDFNGTIAVDGHMKDSVKERIIRLSGQYQVYVITSDTQGTAAKELAGLPVTLKIFDNSNAGECKRHIVEELGGDRCACVGNGDNDRFMFQKAVLSIAVLETEGLYVPILSDADLLVKSSEDALDLLLDTKRLISGLRG
jgi:soluble P-type ATPase